MEERTKDICQIAQRFSCLLQVESRVHRKDGQQLVGCHSQLCSQCRHPKCTPAHTCEYGLREAYRWHGRYIYYCPAGLTFVAACTTLSGQLTGGITLGPFLLGDAYDVMESEKDWGTEEFLSSLPRFSAKQAEALGHILLDAVQIEVIDANVPQAYTPYTPGVQQAQQADIVYKVKAYLREHFRERISLQDVADNVYLSRSYTSTLFKEETGCGISEYLNSIRIDQACDMLRSTSCSLAEIAQACGFEDQSYFNRVFKKALCASPIQYRKSPIPEKKTLQHR